MIVWTGNVFNAPPCIMTSTMTTRLQLLLAHTATNTTTVTCTVGQRHISTLKVVKNNKTGEWLTDQSDICYQLLWDVFEHVAEQPTRDLESRPLALNNKQTHSLSHMTVLVGHCQLGSGTPTCQYYLLQLSENIPFSFNRVEEQSQDNPCVWFYITTLIQECTLAQTSAAV